VTTALALRSLEEMRCDDRVAPVDAEQDRRHGEKQQRERLHRHPEQPLVEAEPTNEASAGVQHDRSDERDIAGATHTLGDGPL
jgi:hypothetical protein